MTNMEAQMALELLRDRVGKMRDEVNNYIQLNGSEALKRRVSKSAKKRQESEDRTRKMVKFGAVVVWMIGLMVLVVGSAKGF